MGTIFARKDPLSITDNAFKLIGTDWMLLTAGTPEKCNTMTASWGGLGHLWDRHVAFCFVRPQRHTFGFMEDSEFYTFSFFEEKDRKKLDYCGSHSGRDENKIPNAGLTPVDGPEETVYFEEARMVFVLRKLYSRLLDRAGFVDESVQIEYYPPENDIHKLYVGEVVTCLVKE